MTAFSRGFVAALLLSATALAADAAAPVVTIGNESVDAAGVARAFGRVPAFQLAALADDDAARRRAIVERSLVPELRAAAEARARKLEQRPRTADRLRELYSRAMDAELARVTEREQPVTDADVKQYFDEHRERFETPRRVRIWRIVVGDEELAKKIISECQGAGGPAKWRNFARDNSLDAATKFRDGDLGFVRPDGRTETPTLRVDPALFAAVDKLADGQIVPEPLKLSSGIAVVWRRGSLPAISRTVEQETPAIRTLLTRQRLEAARKALVTKLRAQYLKTYDPQLLETLPDATFAPPESSARSLPPFPSSAAAPAGAETPRPGENGTR
ncbi:MAG TPA: peptidyl-prolyl cis-trans isomerase [Polyangiaceae bacterium]|nr:peptidyl-prolyl cis-trans isomerase [Polyangiaceae bacterium]